MKENFGFFDKFYGPEQEMRAAFLKQKQREAHQEIYQQIQDKKLQASI